MSTPNKNELKGGGGSKNKNNYAYAACAAKRLQHVAATEWVYLKFMPRRAKENGKQLFTI